MRSDDSRWPLDLRVLHIVTRLGLGGAERVAVTLSTETRARGARVAVLPVAAAPGDPVGARMAQDLAAAGVTILRGSSSSSRKRAALPAAARIARAVQRWAPDVVHLHTEVPEFAFSLATLITPRSRRPPVVVRTIHNTVFWADWSLAGRVVRSRLRSSHAVAVSDAARTAFLVWFGADGACEVIRNGVPWLDVRVVDRRRRHVPRLLYAGRLEVQKGIDVLLDALDAMEPDGPGFTLTIIGTGRLEPMVRARLATSRRYTIDLRPPAGDLRADLAASDALVIPSRFEGLPLTAVEALYAGTPVLATSAPGLAEAFPAGYPAAVPPGDPIALARRISDFIADPSPWLDAAPPARAWARERFDVSAMVDGYLRVYRALL